MAILQQGDSGASYHPYNGRDPVPLTVVTNVFHTPPGPDAAPPRLVVVGYPVLLAVLGAVLAWRLIPGTDDLWAHAAVGRWVWENGRVPDRVLFLWSADDPWVAHSWLSELASYALLDAGVEWVRLAVMALAVAPFAVLWRAWQRQARAAAVPAVLFAVAMACSAARFQARGELA